MPKLVGGWPEVLAEGFDVPVPQMVDQLMDAIRSLDSQQVIAVPKISCPVLHEPQMAEQLAGDWSALWAMVRSECDVAPVQNTARRTEKQQIQSRIRKVATLARTGEKGRALAAARNALPVPVTDQTV